MDPMPSFLCYSQIKLCIHTTAEDEQAFDVLYCVAFEMMDAQWLAMHASYMEFNVISLSLSLSLSLSVIRETN